MKSSAEEENPNKSRTGQLWWFLITTATLKIIIMAIVIDHRQGLMILDWVGNESSVVRVDKLFPWCSNYCRTFASHKLTWLYVELCCLIFTSSLPWTCRRTRGAAKWCAPAEGPTSIPICSPSAKGSSIFRSIPVDIPLIKKQLLQEQC